MRNKLLAIALSLLISGCAKEYYYHGYGFQQNNVESIKVGVTSYDQVISELGSPTSESKFGEKTIYYISNKLEKIAFLDPKIVEQKMLSISFNDKEIVSDIYEYTLDDAQNVAFSEKKTEIHGNTLTPIEQIMTNIGKFNSPKKQF